jgi:hypothetical protein
MYDLTQHYVEEQPVSNDLFINPDKITSLVDQRLKELGVDPAVLQNAGGHKHTAAQSLALTDRVWRNNGWIDPEERYNYAEGDEREGRRITFKALVDTLNSNASKMELQDAQELAAASILIPKVITRIVREAAEPVLVGTSLMRRINFSAGESITFPAVGNGMWAEDIPTGGEYPEQSLEFAGTVQATIGKSGLKVRITEEMIKYSMFDVMTMHLQAGARALARFKEKKIFNLISNEGSVSFDNGDPTAAVEGSTTGRNVNGLFNKTITLDDLFLMYAQMLNTGFVPNVLLMNPMGWLIFARDGVMRNFGFMNNGSLFTTPQGAPGQGPSMSNGGVNMGPSVSQSATALNPQSTLQTPVPSLFPAPLSIVVSPFIEFDPSAKTTSIIMGDRNELGILVVDEDPVTSSWDDPRRDIRSTKIRERYALALDNQGDAVVQAKGVRIAKNYDWEDNLSLQWSIGSGTMPTGFQSGI